MHIAVYRGTNWNNQQKWTPPKLEVVCGSQEITPSFYREHEDEKWLDFPIVPNSNLYSIPTNVCFIFCFILVYSKSC